MESGNKKAKACKQGEVTSTGRKSGIYKETPQTAMQDWVPNPNAKPFYPKPWVRSTGINGMTISYFTSGRCIKKFFKAGLLVVLLITAVINIMYIFDTSKKLSTKQGDKLNDPNVKKMHQGDQLIEIDILSSKENVFVTVDGTTVLQSSEKGKDRGINIVVLNQATGSVMSKRAFDTYSLQEDDAMVLYLNMVSSGRILIFAIKDEGSFSLKGPAREFLKGLGSQSIGSLSYRDMWAFTCVKGGKALGENTTKASQTLEWADKTELTVTVPLAESGNECRWPENDEGRRRKTFCSKVEGYGSVCHCDEPSPIVFPSIKLENNNVQGIPIVVIASDRPHYLYRMLQTLLTVPGADPKMVTIFIDGYFEEPLAVTKLFGLRGIQHTPLGVGNARISQHYKASLTAIFNYFPDAEYTIVIEEDLTVSPDFFNFFSQTKHLLVEDQSLYCISAWNDQGYDHTSKDPGLLYRVESMPGLGWLLKRSLYKTELEPQWPSPEKRWDWDMWMRSGGIRKGRECVIPDISRTYHFGSKGLNINPYFQSSYFSKHKLLAEGGIQLKNLDGMKKDNYEKLLNELIPKAKVADHSTTPCADDFIPKDLKEDENLVLYISMKTTADYDSWKTIAQCLHIWDLDIRGMHKSMWRLFIKQRHVFIIGSPVSEYSKYKPENIVPITLTQNPKTES